MVLIQGSQGARCFRAIPPTAAPDGLSRNQEGLGSTIPEVPQAVRLAGTHWKTTNNLSPAE